MDKPPDVIKPKIDLMIFPDKISIHNAQEYDCQTLENLTDFKNPFYEKYIIIEEAQFFKDLFLFVIDQVELRGKNVIVVGLDGDSDRENFGEIHKLIPLCDDIVKLKAYCSICKDGTLGIFSKRLSQKKDKILIGSSRDYIAVCRECYLK